MFEHTLRGDLGQLPLAANEIRACLEQAGVSQEIVHALDFAIEELVGNIIRHAFPDGDGAQHEIRLQLEITPASVRLTIDDDATPFDPTRAPAPTKPKRLEDAAIGGLGIHMVRGLIRDFRYERSERGNRLVLCLPRAAKCT